MHRESAGAAFRGGLAESAALDDLEEHLSHARRIVGTRIVIALRHIRGLPEEVEPQINWTALRFRRELVDRRLDRERVHHMRRSPPGACRDAGEWIAVAQARAW